MDNLMDNLYKVSLNRWSNFALVDAPVKVYPNPVIKETTGTLQLFAAIEPYITGLTV